MTDKEIKKIMDNITRDELEAEITKWLEENPDRGYERYSKHLMLDKNNPIPGYNLMSRVQFYKYIILKERK